MAIKVYKRGDSTKLSANFRVREFDCHGAGCCSQTKVDEKLVEYLQKIRDHFGKPVNIESGYRCKAHNEMVSGAASKSKHMDGMAADIIIAGVDPLEVAKYAESIGVKGIGHYDDFVHIDTRTSKSFWYGDLQSYRATFGGAPAPAEGEYTLEQFVRDVQEACGAKVDGIAGPETLQSTVTISAKKNRTHPVVEFVQKRLRALGYEEVGEVDGVAGVLFTSAVAHFQQANGCYADGEVPEWGKTWCKLLEMG